MQIIRNRTRLRRLHRRLRRRRRHGRQGADRSRRRRRDARGRADVGPAERRRTCSRGPYDSPRRGAAIPSAAVRRVRRRASAAGRSTASPTRPRRAATFDWFRSRMLGGRTNHWGRISLRFGPDDFRRKSLDGLGDDWPITYDDLKPYYDKVDTLVGIFGSEGGTAQRAGRHLPAAAEAALLRAADQAGRRPAEHPLHRRRGCRSSRSRYNGRPACHYCGQCGRGCAHALELLVAVGAAAAGAGDRQADDRHQRDGARGDGRRRPAWRPASPTSTRPPAARTTCARGSSCWRRAPASRRGSCSTRSRRQFPAGPRQLQRRGRQVPDRLHRRSACSGFIPKMMDGVPHNEDGVGGMHLYMPWWVDNKKLDFPRGYHIELGGGRRHAGVRLPRRHPQLHAARDGAGGHCRPGRATARS